MSTTPRSQPFRNRVSIMVQSPVQTDRRHSQLPSIKSTQKEPGTPTGRFSMVQTSTPRTSPQSGKPHFFGMGGLAQAVATLLTNTKPVPNVEDFMSEDYDAAERLCGIKNKSAKDKLVRCTKIRNLSNSSNASHSSARSPVSAALKKSFTL